MILVGGWIACSQASHIVVRGEKKLCLVEWWRKAVRRLWIAGDSEGREAK